MKHSWLVTVTLVGCAWMLSTTAARAQTTIEMSNSAQFIDFYTGSTPGTLDVILGWEPGVNFTGNHTLNGSLQAGAPGNGAFSLTSFDPLSLTGNGAGTFSANSGELASSVFDISSGSGTAFQGMLTALSFSQALSGSNVVTMQAMVQGTGSFASTVFKLLGSIVLAPGGNINGVANSNTTVDEAGIIVPEPATALLWLTGLGFLAGCAYLRRRSAFEVTL
ncbi:MAG TPA: PEP-CTERM sorting domain-containing protein [Terriglobales bacterium]|nr:PEP-CTERM sorting domain-containing protein [Terriglobales bacterium]